MKKNKMMGIIIGVLCITALMSATAFAEVGNSLLAAPQETPSAQDAGKFAPVVGKITEAVDMGDYHRVQVDDGGMGVIFTVSEDVFVIDQKTGTFKKVGDLEKGMEVVAVLAKNSPMTMSIPPQTPGAVGFVIKSDAGSVELSIFNNELTNLSNTLKLNIADTTKIISMEDLEKNSYTADDVKSSESLVLYSVSTKSIPAQTSPEMVLLLTETDGDSKEAIQSSDLVKSTESETAYVELRTEVEAKGYTVEWTSNKNPIAIIKNDMRAEVTIGSSDFTFTHKTKDLKPLDKLEKMDAPVKLENGKTMISKSFIDALE